MKTKHIVHVQARSIRLLLMYVGSFEGKPNSVNIWIDNERNIQRKLRSDYTIPGEFYVSSQNRNNYQTRNQGR